MNIGFKINESINYNGHPKNFREQDLIDKEISKTINPDEEEELRRIRQLDYRRDNLTYDMQRLWERVEESDPNVVQVDMDEIKTIDIEPDCEEEKIIWSYGFGGCFGILLFCEDKVGHRSVILAHLSPVDAVKKANELVKQIKLKPEFKNANNKQTLVVLGPESNKVDKQTGKRLEGFDMQIIAGLYIHSIGAELKKDLNLKIEPYSCSRDFSEKNYGTFVVRIPPKGQAIYKTWFSQGKID